MKKKPRPDRSLRTQTSAAPTQSAAAARAGRSAASAAICPSQRAPLPRPHRPAHRPHGHAATSRAADSGPAPARRRGACTSGTWLGPGWVRIGVRTRVRVRVGAGVRVRVRVSVHVRHHSTRARANIRPSEPAPAGDREVVKRQEPALLSQSVSGTRVFSTRNLSIFLSI